MTLGSQVRSWMRAMMGRTRMENEMDAELRFHMRAYVEDLQRKGVARELLPDGKIGKASDHNYYEVCTNPALYELVATLKRNQPAAVEATRA